MKYFLALCLASLMAFAANGDIQAEMKDLQMITPKRPKGESTQFGILCIGDYAFMMHRRFEMQLISISTGKPMSCDEAKKAFFK